MTPCNGYHQGFTAHIDRAKSAGRTSIELNLGKRASEDQEAVDAALVAIINEGNQIAIGGDGRITISWRME